LGRKIETKYGKIISQRMVFYEIERDRFKWRWESSSDEGQMWNLQWQIDYTRK
jgi:hypothetical protein